MSDAPVFKQRNSASSQRARTAKDAQSEDGPNDSNLADQESPSTLAMKLKSKNKKNKLKSRLSFGADADQDEESGGEVFQVKKSNLSRKLTLGTHPASHSLNLPKPNDGPKYDDESLKLLKANTKSRSSALPSHDSYDADISLNVDDISMATIENPNEQRDVNIPSESSIKAAKEKRGRLRGTPGSEDFISLSVVKRNTEDNGPHPESRLVREEDELGEGDDEYAEYTSAQERIALGKKSRKAEAGKHRDNMREMIADAEEEDDETMEWEQEQLRRGGHQTPPPSSANVKQEYKPAPIPHEVPLPALSAAVARLTQSMTALTTSHSANTSALASLSEERIQQEKRETELRDMVAHAEDKRSWFVAFREWVETVATFLDEKFPQLENLEQEHLALLQERADMISKRRKLEDEDDLATFLPRSQPVAADDPMETDELGRELLKPTPATRHAERVQRRAQRLQSSTRSRNADAAEGYSTDSSLPPIDQDAYSAAIARVAKKANTLLSDVKASEFRQPMCDDGLTGWWGKWREQWNESYVSAWGGLGLIGALEFWTRLEIVGWNCIQDTKSLDSFRWYHGLYMYSRPMAQGDQRDPAEVELGPDGDLVSSMISTAVVPRLCKIVDSGALDAYSAKDIQRITDLLEELEASVEQGNDKSQMLLKAVYTSFSVAVSGTESLIAQFDDSQQGLPFNPESIPARARFLARRVKLLRNMLRWRRYNKDRFGLGELAIRLIRLIMRISVSGWDVGGEEVMRQVKAMVPGELLPPDIKVRLG